MRIVNLIQPSADITSNDSQNMRISLSLSTYQAFHVKTIKDMVGPRKLSNTQHGKNPPRISDDRIVRLKHIDGRFDEPFALLIKPDEIGKLPVR